MNDFSQTHKRYSGKLQAAILDWAGTTVRQATESDVEELYHHFQPIQLARLDQDSDLIPGVAHAVERMRRRGLKIGSTTGYTRPMLEILLKKAATHGYEPDCSLVPDDP